MTGAWPAVAEMTLDDVRDSWGDLYDIGTVDGVHYACFLTGGTVLNADTPAGLDSAIREDFAHPAGTR